MKKYIYCFAVIVCFLFSSCGQRDNKKDGFNIIGVWTIEKMIFQDGTEKDPNLNGYTRCKVYDADSIYYTVQMFVNKGGVVIYPHETAKFSQHDSIYIENGRETQFEIKNDSVFTTVWNDYIEVWKRSSMNEEMVQEIRDSFNAKSKSEALNNYITGEPSKQDKERTHFYIVLGVLVVIIVSGLVYLIITLRGKRKAQRELQAIIEENDNRSVEANTLILKAEKDFFGSDYYSSLRKRVVKGEILKKADWEEMSAQLKEAFPKFESRLSTLCKMSEVEMQVCMLLKLRFSPSEIATVIIKDASTISSIRGRLYQKVFGKKGGAKDWDEFLKTL